MSNTFHKKDTVEAGQGTPLNQNRKVNEKSNENLMKAIGIISLSQTYFVYLECY